MSQHYGLDAATVLRPYAKDIASGGIEFVCRYLKSLQPSEVLALSHAGVRIVAIWETTAERALGGPNAGAADGTYARSQMQSLGAPQGAAVYATVDCDVVNQLDKNRVAEYVEAFKKSLAGYYRIGLYAEGSLLEICRSFVDFLWLPQASGWDGSRGDSDYHMHQGPTIEAEQTLTWADTDWPDFDFAYDPDIAVVDDFGQWIKATA